MTGYYVLTVALVLLLGVRLWRWQRHASFTEPAVRHVRHLQKDAVEEGLIASMGNLGVVFIPKVLMELTDVVLVSVCAVYSRGGYREHEVFHLVQLDRKKKAVLQCDSIPVAAVEHRPG